LSEFDDKSAIYQQKKKKKEEKEEKKKEGEEKILYAKTITKKEAGQICGVEILNR